MSEAALRNAISASKTVTFSGSGLIRLTAPIVTSTELTIDGSGQSVSLSGGDSNRLFVATGGRLTLRNLRLIFGNAASGGAIYNDGATVEIADCTFATNRAIGFGGGDGNYRKGFGGAIYNAGLGRVTVINSLFLRNRAMYNLLDPSFSVGGYGGVTFNASSNGVMTFLNCTFSENTSVTSAAAMWNRGYIGLTNCTFYLNVTDDYNLGPLATDGGEFSIKNTLFVASMRGSGIIDSQNNLITDSAAWFRPLSDNGGPTWTHALTTNSPAVNVIDKDEAPATDQRGALRAFGRGDIGAFELTTLRNKDFEFSSTNLQVKVIDGRATVVVSRRLQNLSSVTILAQAESEQSNLQATNVTVNFAPGQVTRAIELAIPAKQTPGTNRVLRLELRPTVESTDVVDAAHLELLENDGVIGGMDDGSLRSVIEAGGTNRFILSGVIAVEKAFEILRDTTLDAGTNQVTLVGTRGSRFFMVHPGRKLTLRNIKMTGGFGVGATDQPGLGGAVLNDGGVFSAYGCAFLTNYSVGGDGILYSTNGGAMAAGGGVFSKNGDVILVDCAFIGNQPWGGTATQTGRGGDACGAGLAMQGGSLVMDKCRFVANGCVPGGNNIGYDSTGNTRGGGLALWNVQAHLVDCVFEGNGAGGGSQLSGIAYGSSGAVAFGGAVYVDEGTITVDRCTFRKNFAEGGVGWGMFGNDSIGAWGNGGALCIKTGTVVVIDSVFIANRAQGGYAVYSGFPGNGRGGSIYNAGTITIENSSFATNVAIGGSLAGWSGVPGDGLGGAIYNDGGTATLRHATVVGSIVRSGHNNGGHGQSWPDDGLTAGSNICTTNQPVVLTHSIVANGAGSGNFSGLVTDRGGNICSDNTGQLTNETSLNGTDPQLGYFSKFGGITETFSLRAHSPARDRATNDGCPAFDQRGRQRPFGRCDAGAFEFQPPFLVSGKVVSQTRFEGATVSLGGLKQSVDISGSFSFENVMAGEHVFQAMVPNRLCVPLPRALLIEDDFMNLEFRAYPTGALYMDRGLDTPLALVYGGDPNGLAELQTSPNLTDWQLLKEVNLGPGGGMYVEMPTNNTVGFFRLKFTD